ncbi:MAG TPA: extracellular solute-binding protein [Gaiellaceae bacterium]|jgi:alpha-glucoside transport system substrate-binding protein
MSRKRIAVAVLVVAVGLVTASLAMAARGSHAKAGVNTAVSGTVTFDGIWTSSSGAKQFADVISAFNKKYPNVKIKYKPVGDNLPTVLSTAVAGGHPPDMADIAQPGFVKQLADQGKLKPITYAKGTIAKNFAPAWQQLGTFDGKLYALVFKAANKSLVWYNVPAFKAAGIKAPKTWAQLISDAKTLKASGTPAYSIGGADGWTLTDLFENIYLRMWGPAKYASLSAHKTKWTDSSVIAALKTMGQVLGDTSNLAGGSSGAIQAGFNDSVTNAFSTPAKGAMVFEGDFVAGVILSSTKAKAASGFNVAPFPVVKAGSSGSNGVEIGGDLFVTFRDTPAIRAFVNYLASPEAATVWAKQGGFSTGNHNVKPSVFPDAITRATATPVLQAKSVVFDMSDQQPSAFGATAGQGEWGLFQDFLKNPKDVNGIAKKLEAAAAKAYKKGK